MSVNYSLALMSSKPGNKSAAKLYYAKAQANGEITMDEMAEDIAYATSLTDGDALNTIRALIKQIESGGRQDCPSRKFRQFPTPTVQQRSQE